jgi:hypothetical protein
VVVPSTQQVQNVVTYKANRFKVVNEEKFQLLCGRWNLEFQPSFSPDDRVSFRGERSAPLTDEFWTALSKCIQSRWIVTVMEYDLTMSGFILVTHLVNNKGEHEVITSANLKFKDSVSEKKRKRYLGIKDKKETSNSNSVRLKNRPYKVVEAKK